MARLLCPRAAGSPPDPPAWPAKSLPAIDAQRAFPFRGSLAKLWYAMAMPSRRTHKPSPRSIVAPPNPRRVYYRVREVAALVGLSESTLCKGIYAGRIPSRLIGSARLIPATWVHDEEREPA